MPTHRVTEFDVWRPGYAGSTVNIYKAGTETLASVWTDEALTVSASNPQTLLSRTVNDIEYGKFANPLYTDESYELDIDSMDQTGIVRPPILDFDGEDASKSVVTPLGGSVAGDLDAILGRIVHVEDYGAIGASAATNNATITAAIGAVAAKGGGKVLFPASTFPYTSFTLSEGVLLVGHGRGVTIAQSQQAGVTVQINGERAGFASMTLDGVDKQVGSVGINAKAINEIILNDVDVRRFETGIYCKGGRRNYWRELYIENCKWGVKLHGDNDAGGGADGDEWRHNFWHGGRVTNCTAIGVELSYVDKKCYHNTFKEVGFEGNTTIAINVNGARFTRTIDCWFENNTQNLTIDDDDDTDAVNENTVIGFTVTGGSFDAGTIEFNGTCQDIVFDGVELTGVTVDFNLPGNNIVFRNMIEDSGVLITGQGVKLTRQRDILGNPPGTSGVTSDATATKAWSFALDPGQRCYIEAIVVANSRDTNDYAMYHISRAAHRPGSELTYDNQTDNYTLGDFIEGDAGGRGRAVADTDAGGTGTLTLRDITDANFADNDFISGESSGNAQIDGTLVDKDAVLLGSTVSIATAVESAAAWNADFAVGSGSEIEILVTGEANKTIEWSVHARVVVS